MIFKVYKITCSETGKIYVGSTCRTLRRRLLEHCDGRKQTQCHNFVEPKIILLDITEDKEEMLLSEKFFIQQLNPVNKYMPCQTNKEKKEYKDEWYQQNKKRISDKGKEIIKCECGMSIKKSSKWNHMKTKFHLNNVDN